MKSFFYAIFEIYFFQRMLERVSQSKAVATFFQSPHYPHQQSGSGLSRRFIYLTTIKI